MTFFARHLFVLLLSLVSLIPIDTATAQIADKLVIDGPELENCLVTVRYYKNRQIVKVVALKLSLLKGGIEEPIEAGADGVEIFLQSQAVPVNVSLRAGTREISAKRLDKPGTTTVSAGKIGRVEFTPESIQLEQADTRLLKSYVASLNELTSSQNLVMDSAEAAIDYQCLDVFNRELRQRIGAIDLAASIDNFVAWDSSSKERMLAGVLRGESGSCGIRLVIANGKLTDVQPNCPKLSDDYFREPLDTQRLIKKSEQLVRLVFDGNAQQAHQLYAPQFQQQVKVEQLSKLSETVRERFGTSISSISFKRSQLLDYNFAQKNRLFLVDLLITLDDQIRCIGRVTFSIACDRTRVGKVNLAGVNVSQVFQSSHPQFAQMTQTMLEQLGSTLQAESLISALHPDLKPLCDKVRLQSMLDKLGNQFKGQAPVVDYDLWTVSQYQDFVQASGALKYGDKDCYVELQFAGDNHLVGFSFYGPALAESTLGLLNFPPSIGNTAKQFWTHLLNADAESAHAMLDKDFQTQFSLDEMKQQLAEPESNPAKLKDIQIDSVRLSSQTARPVSLLTTVFLTAEYEDGQIQQVACDIGLPAANSSAAIYDFTNEFETDFPVASIPLADAAGDGADLAIEAFRSKDPQKLLALIEPSRRQAIDQATLQAYFQNFAALAGQLGEPIALARTVEYQLNGKRYRCNLYFLDATNQQLPIEVWFYRGYLERFVVSHPKINDFTQLLKDKSAIRNRVDSFVRAWFRDVNESRPFMISALYTDRTLGALNSMKNEFEQKHGKLADVKIVKESDGEAAGEIEFTVSLVGEKGARDARVLIDVGAFGGLVSAITFQ